MINGSFHRYADSNSTRIVQSERSKPGHAPICPIMFSLVSFMVLIVFLVTTVCAFAEGATTTPSSAAPSLLTLAGENVQIGPASRAAGVRKISPLTIDQSVLSQLAAGTLDTINLKIDDQTNLTAVI